MILEVQFQNLGARTPAHACQSFHLKKIPGGPNINIFFVKIGKELLFTLKNKRRKTNLKFFF